MNKLSVVISAFNEENKIEACLQSAKWADEIIVVDNESTDSTAKIARKFTDKIYTRPNRIMLNINKNFGFTKATGDWILSLDADERITPKLRNEILETTENFPAGYYIPRKNIIFGKWMQHTGWYPDHQLRLFKQGKGRFPEKHVHEMIRIQGETGYLKEDLLHYNYDTIDQFLYKMTNIYTKNEMLNLKNKGYKIKTLDVLRFPAKEFLNRYFAQKGYKDGLHGLTLSFLMAFYHLVVFARLWEQAGFPEKKVEQAELEDAAQKNWKNFRYWILTAKIEQTKSPLLAFFYKLRRKVLK